MEVTLGMVPLMIKPIYAFYSGPLLKGSNTGVPQTAVCAKQHPKERNPRPLISHHFGKVGKFEKENRYTPENGTYTPEI